MEVHVVSCETWVPLFGLPAKVLISAFLASGPPLLQLAAPIPFRIGLPPGLPPLTPYLISSACN